MEGIMTVEDYKKAQFQIRQHPQLGEAVQKLISSWLEESLNVRSTTRVSTRYDKITTDHSEKMQPPIFTLSLQVDIEFWLQEVIKPKGYMGPICNVGGVQGEEPKK